MDTQSNINPDSIPNIATLSEQQLEIKLDLAKNHLTEMEKALLSLEHHYQNVRAERDELAARLYKVTKQVIEKL